MRKHKNFHRDDRWWKVLSNNLFILNKTGGLKLQLASTSLLCVFINIVLLYIFTLALAKICWIFAVVALSPSIKHQIHNSIEFHWIESKKEKEAVNLAQREKDDEKYWKKYWNVDCVYIEISTSFNRVSNKIDSFLYVHCTGTFFTHFKDFHFIKKKLREHWPNDTKHFSRIKNFNTAAMNSFDHEKYSMHFFFHTRNERK